MGFQVSTSEHDYVILCMSIEYAASRCNGEVLSVLKNSVGIYNGEWLQTRGLAYIPFQKYELQ